MFGLSWAQIAIIVLVGVFVLGPERIPTAVTWVLTTLRKARTLAAGAQAELRREIGPELEELRRQVADLQSLKEIQELRDLRDLHPKRLIGKNILGDEFSGGITGFLGLNAPLAPATDSPGPEAMAVDSAAIGTGQTAITDDDAIAEAPISRADALAAPGAGGLNTIVETDGTNSSGANNGGANNSGANNSGANNSGANNGGANNGGANTSGANNSGANTAGAATNAAVSAGAVANGPATNGALPAHLPPSMTKLSAPKVVGSSPPRTSAPALAGGERPPFDPDGT